MRTFQVTWCSAGNIEKGTVVVLATSIGAAQDKFLDWLKKKPIYQHMWNLSFSFTEIDDLSTPEVIE